MCVCIVHYTYLYSNTLCECMYVCETLIRYIYLAELLLLYYLCLYLSRDIDYINHGSDKCPHILVGN